MDARERIAQMYGDYLRERDETARQAYWSCEDGWAVVYTTSRMEGGPHRGAFVAILYRPQRGNLVQDERRICSTRREAKARALTWYRAHSPQWAARHPESAD